MIAQSRHSAIQSASSTLRGPECIAMILLGGLIDKRDKLGAEGNAQEVLRVAAQQFRYPQNMGVVIGNHDIWSKNLKAMRWGRGALQVPGALCYEFKQRVEDGSMWHFLVLDSMSSYKNFGCEDELTRIASEQKANKGSPKQLGLHGAIGPVQLQWLRACLQRIQSSPSKPAVAVFCHMPVDISDLEMSDNEGSSVG